VVWYLLLACGGLEVGHGDVELLLDGAAVDLLVHYHADGALRDEEYVYEECGECKECEKVKRRRGGEYA
jgi:hypothetical protein